jgi:hypothetical protein
MTWSRKGKYIHRDLCLPYAIEANWCFHFRVHLNVATECGTQGQGHVGSAGTSCGLCEGRTMS